MFVRFGNVLALIVAFAGCGSEVQPLDAHGAGLDAGIDASTVATDAGRDAGDNCIPTERRYVECGACGTAPQVCQPDRTWGPSGVCSGEGECTAGVTETEDTPLCGRRRRTCDAACNWAEWDQRVPDGVCEPGDVQEMPGDCGPGEVVRQTCQDDCIWSRALCRDACGPDRRVTPADAEELCIPAGPFNRGVSPRDDLAPGASPMAEVYVSAFYMDRFPVTNERYQRCIDAGGCPELAGAAGSEALSDPGRARHPVQEVPYGSAEAFCLWDGGRRLPTEAEWEKAARGPAPRTVIYPWGDEPDCAYFLRCGPGGVGLGAIDGLPRSASYYGAEKLVGGGQEWVSDFYDEYYYGAADSLRDPTGPATGVDHVRRGWPAASEHSGIHQGRFRVFYRYRFPNVSRHTTFRCARSATPTP